MKYAVRVPLLLIASLGSWHCIAAESTPPVFSDWYEKNLETEVGLDRESYLVAITRGASAGEVLEDLTQRIATLEMSEEREREWKRVMLCQLQDTNPRKLDGIRPGKPVTAEALKLQQAPAAGTSPNQLADLDIARFRASPFATTGNYDLFIAVERGCGSISIPPEWDGHGAREIVRVAEIARGLLQQEGLPSLDSMARTVASSRARWERFFEKAVFDGLPWEFYFNEFMRGLIPPLRGTLARPPLGQLRFAHPTPLMAVETRGKMTFNENFGIEVLGWRQFKSESYDPRFGVSVLASLRESKDESTGWGLLLTLRGWSMGAVVRDTATKRNDVQVVVGVDVANWIQEKRVQAGAIGQFKWTKEGLGEGWKDACKIFDGVVTKQCETAAKF